MTKSFDEICENIMAGTQQAGAPQPNAQGTPQPTPAPGTPQTTPAAQPATNPAVNDQELFKVLQQRMNDQKFKDALLKMLTPQPNAAPNAVNKPV